MVSAPIDQFLYEGILFGMIIRANFTGEGIQFFTQESEPLQVGYMNRAKGYKIQAHTHKEKFLGTQPVHEVLFVKSGKVKVSFFHTNGDFFAETIIRKGDIILLAHGAHSFEMLEQSELFEVKQGPYSIISDKNIIGTQTEIPMEEKHEQ